MSTTVAMPPDLHRQALEFEPVTGPIPAARQAAMARGDELRAQGKALALCWLPEPQERGVLGPMPGKRGDGKLWFE